MNQVSFFNEARNFSTTRVRTVRLRYAGPITNRVYRFTRVLNTTLNRHIKRYHRHHTIMARNSAFSFSMNQPTQMLRTRISATTFLSMNRFTPRFNRTIRFTSRTYTRHFFSRAINTPNIRTGRPTLQNFTSFPNTKRFTFEIIKTTRPSLPTLSLTVRRQTNIKTIGNRRLTTGNFSVNRGALMTASRAPFFRKEEGTRRPYRLFGPHTVHSATSYGHNELYI